MKTTLSKRFIQKTAAFAGSLMLAASANAFDNIYIFGDSLSDTGNIKIVAAQYGQQAPERFSNGPVAVDIIAGAYGLLAEPSLLGGNNYAFGGATALGSETEFDTNLPIQVNSYLLNNNYAADPNALYAVIIGGNDIFDAQEIRAASVAEDSGEVRQQIREAAEARITQASASVEAQLMKLVASGAQNILVGNAPAISLVPNTHNVVAGLSAVADDHQESTRAGKFYKYTSKLVSQYNEELAAVVARVEAAANIDIVEWDMQSFLENQIEDAELLGYSNTTESCAHNGALPVCDGYVFVDTVHPTTVVHQRAGAEVLQLLNQ